MSTQLTDLPDEVILQILWLHTGDYRCLLSFRRVCWRFARLAVDDRLWFQVARRHFAAPHWPDARPLRDDDDDVDDDDSLSLSFSDGQHRVEQWHLCSAPHPPLPHSSWLQFCATAAQACPRLPRFRLQPRDLLQAVGAGCLRAVPAAIVLTPLWLCHQLLVVQYPLADLPTLARQNFRLAIDLLQRLSLVAGYRVLEGVWKITTLCALAYLVNRAVNRQSTVQQQRRSRSLPQSRWALYRALFAVLHLLLCYPLQVAVLRLSLAPFLCSPFSIRSFYIADFALPVTGKRFSVHRLSILNLLKDLVRVLAPPGPYFTWHFLFALLSTFLSEYLAYLSARTDSPRYLPTAFWPSDTRTAGPLFQAGLWVLESLQLRQCLQTLPLAVSVPTPRLSFLLLLLHPVTTALYAISSLGRPDRLLKLTVWSAFSLPFRYAEHFFQQWALMSFPIQRDFWPDNPDSEVLV